MGMWIKRSKDTLHSIIDHVKAENEGLTVRVGFVAYRDFCDGKNRLNVTDFTTDIDAIKKKIQGQRATGGGDMPEDVQGGLNKALGLSWQSNSVKMGAHTICVILGAKSESNRQRKRNDHAYGNCFAMQ